MLSVSDFFCGCGGLSQGFREAGFNIKNGIDFNKSFLETYAQNFPEAKVLNLDLGDNKFIDKFENEGGDGISVSELEDCLKYKKIRNVELIKGDINSTLEGYILKNPAVKVALLHIDVDVEKPTKTILENLYDKVVPGGLIVLDDYGVIQGETKAVDDFFSDMKIKLQKLPLSKTPVFIVKE